MKQSSLVGSAWLARSVAAETGLRPNLLYIFADQWRLQALGFWKKPRYRGALAGTSDPVHTPNLDRLADESVVLTQATSTHPVCSPHRAMLMSGMYPSQNGVEGGNCRAGRSLGLRHDITCFTDVLSQAGYETAYVGKTHWERTEPFFDQSANFVGSPEPPGGHYANNYDTYIPPGRGRHGVSHWFQQIRDNHHDAFAYSNQPRLVGGKKDGQMYRPRTFTPKVEADVVIDYLENRHGERDSSKPFSILWSPNPPHSPYARLSDCEKDIYDRYYADMPAGEALNRSNVDVEKAGKKGKDPRACAPIYYALCTGVDRQIGRVLKALEEAGEADNTIVVFTADHGEMMGSHGAMGKNQIHDESFLVPFMIRYPNRLKPRLEDLLLGTVDIMPSMLGLMGLTKRIPDTVAGLDYSRGLQTGRFEEPAKPESA
ncbi:MAG: sulfatase, partial [Verrucomicrobiota bacterium]